MMQIPQFLVVILILLALVILYVTRPLFTARPENETPAPEDATTLQETEYQAILENIRELDFEFKLGKMSAQEHEEQRAALILEAAQTLSKIRSAEPPTPST
jgi:hypothetical protein